MSKSKSVYKTDLPSFFRKSSFDIKSMQGLNPQIFTIQAQSFINQNFFHNNAELMHEKSNNFISNLRKLNQKKLKSERTTSDMKKINNKSASSFAGSSTLEGGWTRKLNLRLNTSAQNRDPIKVNNKSRKIIPIDLKQIENVFENLMNISISGTHTNKELDEVFVGLYDKTPNNDNNNNSNMSGILQILKNFLEKSLGIVSSNANEIKDLKETLKEFNRMKEEEMRKHLSEISELKKSLETQTTQLQMLQAKEKQLIQFLLAIKARGVIDLESIFNEEFNMAKPSEPKKKNSISLEKTTKSKTILPGSSFFELSQEADISIINDSEESSFNYLGKSENSGVLTPMPVPKVYLNQGNKKNKGLPDNLKLNLKDIPQESPENPENKEQILPSDDNNKDKDNDNNYDKNNDGSEKVGLIDANFINIDCFKKKKIEKQEKMGINEEMKENLLEKLRNFRKVYEKLSKK